MSRIATALLVVCLLGGTAAAFAVTEGLKLDKSPILSTSVTKVFSPVCDCETQVATISFRLRENDTLRVQIVHGDRVVRTLVEGDRRGRGTVFYSWDGRDDAGRIVPDGVYRARVHLSGERRTIEFPNDILVDTGAPSVQVVSVRPTVFSPDGDGRREAVVVRYRTSEPAHGLLVVDGRRRVRTRSQVERGRIEWFGRVDGRPLRQGVYGLQVAVEDRAGNRSARSRPIEIQVRYIGLGRKEIMTRPRARFGVRVSTDARRVAWRLGRRAGTAPAGVLVLRAPAKPGRVALVVEANGHRDRAVVIVRRR